MARRKTSNLEELIRRFQESNRAPRARTSGRPNTTPQNLTKKRGLPAARRFDRTQTFKRSSPSPPGGYYREDDPRWMSPRIVPGLGQYRNQKNPKPPRTGWAEGIPPASRASRPRQPRRSSRRRLRSSPYN